jgi:hypothetical protein
MSYKEQLQSIWRQFEKEHGFEPSTIRDCFEWAYQNKLWSPRPQDIAKIFGREMAEALRQEMRTDASGRRYRAKHCIRVNYGGVQMPLWGDIDKHSRTFLQQSFGERREGSVKDLYQLKQDVDHFNEFRSNGNHIQLILDFTDDVAELEAVKRSEEKSAA